MRKIIKSRTEATTERLGGCGFPGCQKSATCSNCVQCDEHHKVTTEAFLCGFELPKPIDFTVPIVGAKTDVELVVVEDGDPQLETR